MKRWNTTTKKEVENPKIDAMLTEIAAVCKKHGLSLSHEDWHGAFEVKDYDESNTKWLMDAQDATKQNPEAVA